MWTKKGQLMVALCTILFIAAIVSNIPQVYVIFSFFFSMLILSYILFPSDLSGLAAKRYLGDRHAFEGETVDIKLDVTNNRFTKFFLEIWDVFPAVLKKKEGQDYIVTRLGKNQRLECEYSIECYKRGVYSIGPIKIRTTDPFGFFVHEDKILSFFDLTVYPHRVNIDRLPLKTTRSFVKIGAMSSPARGDVGEFHSIREYRQGDDLKYVHWKSSARTGELVVKEFERVTSTDIMIFLDMEELHDVGIGRETTFEYGVRIAASVSDYALKKGNNVGLIAHGQKRGVISVDRGEQQFIRILNFLAGCEANGELPIEEVIQNEGKFLECGSTAIIITTSNDDDFISSILSLRAKNIHVIAAMLNMDSFYPDYEIEEEGEDEYIKAMNDLLPAGVIAYVINKGDHIGAKLGGGCLCH